MKLFAEFLVKELAVKIPAGQALYNIAHGSDRYVLYKVGPVLSVSVRKKKGCVYFSKYYNLNTYFYHIIWQHSNM